MQAVYNIWLIWLLRQWFEAWLYPFTEALWVEWKGGDSLWQYSAQANKCNRGRPSAWQPIEALLCQLAHTGF